MPVNVFANSSSSYDNDNKIDTSLFVRQPFLRSNYIEANTEEVIDLKSQYRIRNLTDPISFREAASKNYVDNKYNDDSIIKNTENIDLNDANITNARFVQVNQLPQIDSHLTAKLYVDNAIDEQSLLRLDPDEKLKQDSIVLNFTLTSRKTINELATKSFVVNKFNDPSIIKNTDHIDFNDKTLDNIRFVKVHRIPTREEHLTPILHVDKSIRLYMISYHMLIT